jgi:hypothetical protein
MPMTVNFASNNIVLLPVGGVEEVLSLEGAHVHAIPPRPALPAGGQQISTMPSPTGLAYAPPQQYTNLPQQWRVIVVLEAGKRELVLPMGTEHITNQGTWLNTAAGAQAAVDAIEAAIP